MKRTLLLLLVSTSATLAVFIGVPMASAGDTQCTGTITGPHDNVVVPEGAVCIIHNATIRGSVKALQDSRLYIRDSSVRGNIDGDKADAVQVVNNTIGGSVQIKEGGPNAAAHYEAAVCANTLRQGNIQIEKMTSTIGILVGSPGTLVGLPISTNCDGNTLNKGNIKVEENTASGLFHIRANSVGTSSDGGNLQVFKNRGPADKQVNGNTVTKGTIQCKENTPPFTGGPNAGKAEGQCFGT